ncbi:MAG: flavin reductase, partial [Candidatus Korarchaeum sp.]
MIEVKKFYLLLHPRPAYVVGSGKWGERVNFMAASWVSPVGEEPPSVMVALGTETLTLELIEKYGDFSVNVVP